MTKFDEHMMTLLTDVFGSPKIFTDMSPDERIPILMDSHEGLCKMAYDFSCDMLYAAQAR